MFCFYIGQSNNFFRPYCDFDTIWPYCIFVAKMYFAEIRLIYVRWATNGLIIFQNSYLYVCIGKNML